ncbi:cysteine hydrolase family protein [Homoserinibacter sp. YIM 151385]|uniref:cysteine hydrolase family protein n=1 Tax=Homoserinibacter sp. YIM 151385 TaxID=2985506 RepID=UPI0022F0D356|nr:cysteine hydrolase [Homoserinibacter sp. YIM 151385]WBU36744.1 cysteine hydrolase [Homoserinibacter sp. YIM 151385]
MTAPWLVAIDLQHVFADPASPWGSPDYPTAAAGVERLLPAFAGRTVLTRFVAPASPAGAWVPYYRDWPFALVGDDDPLYALTAPFDAVEARIETRETFGKWDAGLAAAVDGADEIVLAGVATDCCVLSTALAAADAGVRVRIPVDACAGGTREDHDRALAAMSLYAPLIELTSVDELLAG